MKKKKKEKSEKNEKKDSNIDHSDSIVESHTNSNDEIIHDKWVKVLEEEDILSKKDIESVWDRPVSDKEYKYLKQRYPFLQIIDNREDRSEDIDLSIITADTQWKILDYGHALSSSPGELMFIREIADDDDDDGDGGIRNKFKGHGTIVKQAFDTATQMVRIAAERGWPSVFLVDGHRLMLWAAWVESIEQGMRSFGFHPTEEEEKKRERIKRDSSEIEKICSGMSFRKS